MEVTNQMLENLICCIRGDRLRQWDHALPKIEFAYNGRSQSVTGVSLFALVYMTVSKHVIDLFCLPKGHRSNVAAERIAEEVRDIQSEVKKRLK